LILVDSSAWVEYDRATASVVERRLTELIDQTGPIALTDPITMELLAGARHDADESRLRRLLGRARLLAFDPVRDFDGATRIYRLCRRRGVTPRDMIDCMIASVALRHRAAVLAQDIDFARIATVVPLELDPATPRDP
jgi:predicted nucleic acid-binding protein